MNENSSKQVRFLSYNPYEARHPGLRVVSRETLMFIKLLRANGYSVIVEPEDGTKLNYLSEKGLREALTDPIIAFILGAYVSFIINLASSWVYEWLKGGDEDNINLILEFDEKGKKIRYSHKGTPISDERFLAIVSTLSERKRLYNQTLQVTPPDPNLPIPIHLEHSDKIVGWGEKVVKDDTGLKVEGIKIIDDEIWHKIQSGELTGCSIAGIITRSTCSICNGEYVDCNHIATKIYVGQECTVRIDSFLVADLSLVKKPVNPLSRITNISA
jgi:hypothetical protein